MRATELIKQLEEIKNKHGDVDLFLDLNGEIHILELKKKYFTNVTRISEDEIDEHTWSVWTIKSSRKANLAEYEA